MTSADFVFARFPYTLFFMSQMIYDEQGLSGVTGLLRWNGTVVFLPIQPKVDYRRTSASAVASATLPSSTK
jgi:hypothetical protein